MAAIASPTTTPQMESRVWSEMRQSRGCTWHRCRSAAHAARVTSTRTEQRGQPTCWTYGARPTLQTVSWSEIAANTQIRPVTLARPHGGPPVADTVLAQCELEQFWHQTCHSTATAAALERNGAVAGMLWNKETDAHTFMKKNANHPHEPTSSCHETLKKCTACTCTCTCTCIFT